MRDLALVHCAHLRRLDGHHGCGLAFQRRELDFIGYRVAGMLVDTAGDTASAVLRAWTRGDFGLTAPPYVEDSDDDTLYCRLDIADYTEPWDFPNVSVQTFSTEDDGERTFFNPSAAPYSLLRLYVDDWHRWYVRVRLPRASGPQAGVAFTVFAPRPPSSFPDCRAVRSRGDARFRR